MRVLHQTLHLQHHRHTGRVLHHRHTSYRGLAVVLVLAAVSIFGLNMMAHATADTITVYARNPAPIPTVPAVINQAFQRRVVTQSRLRITGTCPVISPRVIIAIIDNGNQVGSVPCGSNNNFDVEVVLTPGENDLVARTYTITDDAGPDSAPVTVFYTPPAGQPVSSISAGSQTSSTSSLTVTLDEPFIVFGPGKDAEWLGTITGGTLPYRVHFDWGDKMSDDYTVTKSGHQSFTHHYYSMEPHTITLRVIDADGRGALQHYAAVTPYVTPTGGPLATTPRLPWNGSTPLGLYGAYLLLLVIFGALWARGHQFEYAKAPVKSHPRPAAKRKAKSSKH